MCCKASCTIHTCAVIFFLVFTIIQASINWEITTKPLVIGGEARLDCKGFTCPPNNIKKWLDGRHYDLLCFDNQSKNASKYKMTSNGTNFELMIKNVDLNDVNCEYTCACGFQQYTNMLKIDAGELIYPPRIRRNDLEQKDGLFFIDVLFQVNPLPDCKLMLKDKVLSANISVETISDGGFKLFEVDIQHEVEPEDSICKGNITLHCEVGSNVYSHNLHILDQCKDENEDDSTVVLSVIISVAVIVSVVVCVVLLLFIKCRYGKEQNNSKYSECDKDDTSDQRQSNTCMVPQFNTGATDERTPCKK